MMEMMIIMMLLLLLLMDTICCTRAKCVCHPTYLLSGQLILSMAAC